MIGIVKSRFRLLPPNKAPSNVVVKLGIYLNSLVAKIEVPLLVIFVSIIHFLFVDDVKGNTPENVIAVKVVDGALTPLKRKTLISKFPST